MKRYFFTIIIMLFVTTCAMAGAWSNKNTYEAYRVVRASAQAAEERGDFKEAARLYTEAGDLAYKFASKRIAAWQYNNAGFCWIKNFKVSFMFDDLKIACKLLQKAQFSDANNEVIKKNEAYCADRDACEK